MSYPNNKKKSNRRRNWIIGIAVFLLLVVLAVSKRGGNKSGQEVTAEKAQARTIVQTVEATGRIYPETEVAITSDVSGTIVELLVQEGDSVREGQLLARINSDIIAPTVDRAESAAKSSRAQVDNLRATQKQAESQLESARTIFNRNAQLLKEGLISQADYDNSQSALRSAEASLEAIKKNINAGEFNVASADATVKEQRENLRRTNIYAPMSGVVSHLSKKKGEQVVGTIQMAGTEIMRIANLRALEVRVDVNEIEILKVALGDTADIEVDAYPDRKFKGIVTHIANSASNLTTGNDVVTLTSDKVTNFTVKIHMLESAYRDLLGSGQIPFRPGMSASANIRTQTLHDVLSVPVASVTIREDSTKAKKVGASSYKQLVFIHVGDSVTRREVTTGIQDDSYIYVRSGLNAGDEVITGPYTAVSKKLKPGDKVKIVKEKDLYEKK